MEKPVSLETGFAVVYAGGGTEDAREGDLCDRLRPTGLVGLFLVVPSVFDALYASANRFVDLELIIAAQFFGTRATRQCLELLRSFWIHETHHYHHLRGIVRFVERGERRIERAAGIEPTSCRIATAQLPRGAPLNACIEGSL